MSKGVALVTGSNRGIGRSTIEEFAKAGLDVIINYCHHEDEARELAKYIIMVQRLLMRCLICIKTM